MNAEKLDEKLTALESIVKELEKEDIPIEEALDLYAKGKVTVEECKNKIDMTIYSQISGIHQMMDYLCF